jgi:hypothetical protein
MTSQTPEPSEVTDPHKTRRAAGQRVLLEIREIQKAGLRPAVRPMTVYNIQNRAILVEKYPSKVVMERRVPRVALFRSTIIGVSARARMNFSLIS